MICDVVKPDGEPYEGDPRHVLRRALERMSQMGFDTFNVGPELEYFLFADSAGTERLDEGGYFAMTALDAATDLRYETIKALEAVGIPIEYHHHEVAPSQHEIDMRYAPALEMADSTMTYRLIVKEVAAKHGVYATFMPKPLYGENGSGMHTHMSLFKDGRNQFYAQDESYHLSAAGRQFIAGLLHHAREISAVFAQWVNSYKRLVPGFEAPVYVAWSQRNRSALVRIPLYKPGSEQGTRAELRCPDPACNPYLTFAALLHAGLEGIARGYELPPPMETNLYHLTRRGAGGARDRVAPGDARRGDRRVLEVGADAARLRRPHLRQLREAEARRVGRLPRPAHAVGARPVPVGALEERADRLAVDRAGRSRACRRRSARSCPPGRGGGGGEETRADGERVGRLGRGSVHRALDLADDPAARVRDEVAGGSAQIDGERAHRRGRYSTLCSEFPRCGVKAL